MNLREGRSRLTGLALQKRLASLPLYKALRLAKKKRKLMWHGTPGDRLEGKPRLPFHVGTKPAAMDAVHKGHRKLSGTLHPFVVTPSRKLRPFGKAKRDKFFGLTDHGQDDLLYLNRPQYDDDSLPGERSRGKARLRPKVDSKDLDKEGGHRYFPHRSRLKRHSIFPYLNSIEDKGSLSVGVSDPDAVSTLPGLAQKHKKDPHVARRRKLEANKLRRLRKDKVWRSKYRKDMDQIFPKRRSVVRRRPGKPKPKPSHRQKKAPYADDDGFDISG